MTNKKRFLRDGVMLSVVALISRGVSMAFSVFLSASVGSEGLGLFTLIMTVYSFALTLATSGVGLAVTRAVAADADNRRAPLRSALHYAVLFGFSTGALMISFSPFICLRLISSPEALPMLHILALSLPATAVCAALGGYFVGVRRVRANAIVQIISQLLRVFLSYALVSAVGGGGVIESLRLICLSILLTEIFSLVLMALQYAIDSRIHKSTLKKRGRLSDIASVALPLAFSQYVRSALISAEHILIPKRLVAGGMTQSEALSGYGSLHGMALPAILLPMSPLSSFSSLLVPEFADEEAKGNRGRMSYLASRAIAVTITYASLSAAVFFTFSQDIGQLVYSSAEAGRYLRILAPVIPIMYLDHVCDQMLKGIGEQVYSMWVNIADSALSLVLVFFLLPRMGTEGYALVIILMEAFNFLMSIWRLSSRIRLAFGQWLRLALPLPLAAVSCCVSARIFADRSVSVTAPILIMEITVAICVFVALDRIATQVLCNINKTKKTQKNN